MKKFFLLISALVLSIAMNAKEIEIGSGTSNIIHYTIAASTTSDGDVIVLTSDGDQPYFSTAGEDDYTKLVKDLTIKAADGVHPVVKLEVPFRSTGGKTVKFIGITFDGSSLTSYDWYFRFYDANDNLEFEDCEFKNISKYVFDVYTGKSANSLKLTNCRMHDISSRGILNRGTLNDLEINGGQIYNFTGYPVLDNYDGATLGKVKINGTEFYNNAKDIISGVATSHADSCIINNCYFHNNSRSAVYFTASSVEGVETCDGVIVKNSTFANNDLSASSRSVIEVQNYGGTEAANIEVTVDHCTFYNNKTVNFDYSCVRSRKSTKVSITNSIFAYPSEIDFYATNCYGGTISNTLVYNLSRGHRSSGGAPAITNTLTADPLFVDAANGDFSLAGNWATGNISPARGAATDGSDLGDPRWYSAEVLPSTDFVAPYQFVGAKAKLSGNIWYNSDDAYLYYNNKSTNGTATWKIHAERACAVGVTLNIHEGSPTVHKLRVNIMDADGNSVGELSEQASTLPGTIAIPAEGDYTITLNDDQGWTSAQIDNITLAYVGGATIIVPANELIGEEAVIVDNGHKKVYKLANGDLQYDDNGTPLGEYVYWNINATKYGRMDVTANVVALGEGDPSGHEFLVELYSDLNEAPIASSAEPASTSKTGEVNMPALNIPATGNYIVKLTNQKQWSSAILHSIEFAYAGGEVADVPGQILGADAMLLKEDGGTLKMYHDENGDIQYNDNGNNLTEYALWNINATEAGEMIVTLNVTNSGHLFTVELYDGETLLGSAVEPDANEWHSGNLELEDHLTIPAAGSYTIKLINREQYSGGAIHGITFTKVVPPTIVTMTDTDTDISAWESYVNPEVAATVQLNRTFQGGMYNTVCLPFTLSLSKCKAIFGDDVELYTLGSAELDGEALVLNFDVAGDINRGTPVMMKTSSDVVNPLIEGVYIKNSAADMTPKNAANFVGSFVAQTFHAGDQVLLLMANNTLAFPQSDKTLKGFRAYFSINNPNNAPIRKARIVTPSQVPTEIDLVNTENRSMVKTIENGQLIIIRDGKTYNAIGQMVK